MKASDVMVPHVITVGPELDVKAVANTLATNKISAVPVIDINNNILGIVSEGYLTRRIASSAERKRPAGSHGPKAKDVHPPNYHRAPLHPSHRNPPHVICW